MDLEVLYDDNHLIVVNKKAGDIVQGDKTGDEPLSEKIKAYIKEKYNKPGAVFLGTVHRLDRPVSGIVLYAKTSKALERMNKLFQEKNIQKTYWAVVEKAPEKKADCLENFLLKNEKQNKSYVYEKEVSGSKKAILNYKLLTNSDKYFLLEVALKTGRHHQIRAQLAHIGCVIKGDLKYGSKRSNSDASIHLHARHLSFEHPVSKEKVSITAPVPSNDTLWKYFERNKQVSSELTNIG